MNDAIARGASSYAVFKLQGKIRLNQARKARESRQIVAYTRSAVDAFQKAKEQARDNETQFIALSDLATSYLTLANFVPSERQQLLKEAAACQEAAAQIDTNSFGYQVYTGLGNIYEDLAWLPRGSERQEVTDYYDKAVEYFQKAIRAAPAGLPGPQVDLGRCCYKREVDSGETGRGYLMRAEECLQTAISYDKSDPNKPLREHNAKARRWLAKVRKHQAESESPPASSGMFAAAEALFAEARDIAKAQNSPDRQLYAEEWAAARLNDPTFSQATIQAHIRGLLADADGAKNDAHRKRLQVLLARSLEKEKKWDLARQVYDEALPELDQTDELDVSLLNGRAWLPLYAHNSKWESIDLKEFAAMEADAERVIEILQDNASAQQHHDLTTLYVAHARATFDKGMSLGFITKAVQSLQTAVERGSPQQRQVWNDELRQLVSFQDTLKNAGK